MKKKGDSARLAAEGLPLIHGASPQHDGLWQSRKIIFVVILPDTSIIKESASPKDGRHPHLPGCLLHTDLSTVVEHACGNHDRSKCLFRPPNQSKPPPLTLPNNISRKCHHITLVQGFRSTNP